MHIEITKAKIKSRIFLAYDYTQHLDGVQNKISTSSDAPIHPDLEQCFKNLVPHFAFMAEEATDKDVEGCIQCGLEVPEHLTEKFVVTGFSIGGPDDGQGVTITGQKRLTTGKVINFNTPFQKFYDDNNPYDFEQELVDAIDKMKEEVMLYMEGKQAEKKQMEMDFGEDTEEDEFEPVGIEEEDNA